MLRSIFIALCGLVLLVALPSCDDVTDDGSFSANVIAAGSSFALSGDAYFAEDRSGAEPTFVLLLTPNDLDDFDDPEFENIVAVVIRRTGQRPNPGLTVITDPQDDGIATAFYLSAPSRQGTATLIADSGTLTIDEFEDDELKGTFSFTGLLLDPNLENGSTTASVNGRFEAAEISGAQLPDLASSLPTGS